MFEEYHQTQFTWINVLHINAWYSKTGTGAFANLYYITNFSKCVTSITKFASYLSSGIKLYTVSKSGWNRLSSSVVHRDKLAQHIIHINFYHLGISFISKVTLQKQKNVREERATDYLCRILRAAWNDQTISRFSPASP